jgi:hypothetical protein
VADAWVTATLQTLFEQGEQPWKGILTRLLNEKCRR